MFPPVCALRHGNLERLHAGDSGLFLRSPRAGIHDVSSCGRARQKSPFSAAPLSDTRASLWGTREEKSDEEKAKEGREGGVEKMKKMKTGAML